MLLNTIFLISSMIGFVILLCIMLSLIKTAAEFIWQNIINFKDRKQVIKKGTVFTIENRQAVLKRDLNIRYKKIKLVKCVSEELREDMFVGYNEITTSLQNSRFNAQKDFEIKLLNKLIEDKDYLKGYIEWK